MRWAELTLKTWRENVEIASNLLHEAGAGGVVIEDPRIIPHLDEDVIWENPQQAVAEAEDKLEDKVYVVAYLPWDRRLSDKIKELTGEIQKLGRMGFDISPTDLTISEMDEDSWSEAWKEHFRPVHMGRISVRPTWCSYEPRKDEEIVIDLDPGMAFGTGTHPTTIMCLGLIQEYLTDHQVVFDLGSGSGILAIAAAKLGAQHVYAYDIDHIACKAARQNTQINQVSDLVTVIEGDVKELVDGEADLVIGNLVASIIIDAMPVIQKVLKRGGHFIASGIAASKEGHVKDVCQEWGFQVVQTERSGDWVSLVMTH